jgi:hypothetical protein
MSSVTLLRVGESELHIVARDYGPLWPICVHMVNSKSVIGANVGAYIRPCDESPGQRVLGGHEHLHIRLAKIRLSDSLGMHRTVSRWRRGYKVHFW